MSRFVKALCLAGAASAAVVIAASPAVAATTYTVTAGSAAPGTKVNFTGKTTGATPQVHFSAGTQNLTCDSGTAKGFTTTGNARAARGIATITGAAFKLTNCIGPGGLPLFVTGSGAWKLNATGYNATTGTTTLTITNISAHVQTSDGTTCAFDVTGTVQATYTNSTQILSVKTTNSTLTLSNLHQSCFGLLNDGDHATFRANYKIKATNAAFNPIHIVRN
jgi:hypothetical protein